MKNAELRLHAPPPLPGISEKCSRFVRGAYFSATGLSPPSFARTGERRRPGREDRAGVRSRVPTRSASVLSWLLMRRCKPGAAAATRLAARMEAPTHGLTIRYSSYKTLVTNDIVSRVAIMLRALGRADGRTVDELHALGHEPMSPMQTIRARWFDCCAGSAHEVRCCVAIACPSWPSPHGERGAT
jgi:hypothetical protein